MYYDESNMFEAYPTLSIGIYLWCI